MEDTLVIEFIMASLKLEISNHFEVCKNEIVIYLDDGTKAKITTKNVA